MGSPVEIKGKYSEDLDLFYSVDEMRDVYDFSQDYYSQLCQIANEVLSEEGDRLTFEGYLMESHMYNYLSEEVKARDILYYVCALDESLTDEEQKNFHMNRL